MMKRIFLIFALVLNAVMFQSNSLWAQTYTKPCTDKALYKKARAWVRSGVWRNGFDASPDKSVNVVDFYEQYQKNTAQWDSLFKWMATHDLEQIKAGSHPIDGTTMKVSVEDSENETLEKRGSESHYHHIDFQYVVKGIERFGIIEHETSTPNCKYQPDVIHYNYALSKTRFYDSNPKKFFLFFPSDWHIAKVKTDKSDQKIRVLVVKVDYK
jgi:biofilm protein TabA